MPRKITVQSGTQTAHYRTPGCMICVMSTRRPCCWPVPKVHVVAARLGHADPSITPRVYAHVINNQLAEAADISARVIRGRRVAR